MEMDMPIPKGRGFTPFPFGQCQVCGAEATGNHYGANTCEGCKGFFKRSLPVFRTFRCFFGNKCDVTPETRNRCKACRFRKCVEAGMALDAVKMGRIPKAVKEHAMEGRSSSASSSANRQVTRQNSGVSRTTASSPPSSPSPLGNVSSPASSSEFNESVRGDEVWSPSTMTSHTGEGRGRGGGGRGAGGNGMAVGVLLHHQQQQQQGAAPPSYRFHPYEQQRSQHQHQQREREREREREERFKVGDRLYGYGGAEGLRNAGSSGLVYVQQSGRRTGEESAGTGTGMAVDGGSSSGGGGGGGGSGVDRSDWQPTFRMQLPTLDTCRPAGERKPAGNGGKPAGVEMPVGGQKLAGLALSGGSVSQVFSGRNLLGKGKSHHPEVRPVSGRALAMAEMAITGDFNENEPDLMEDGVDGVKAEMVNGETAVAVMEPSLRGQGQLSMPVVPGDVFVFQPSYVPHEKIPESFEGNLKRRILDYVEGTGGVGGVVRRVPALVTVEDFWKMGRDEGMKRRMCQMTLRTVKGKNAEIYGEETRANEEFLRESLEAGDVVKEVEHTPQEMRDILKDRLITQVKRVVQLSESISGFRSLGVDDQHSLLRTCILDVWMVHSARFMRNNESYILFLESKTHYARRWMELFLTDEFLETVFQIARKINGLELSFDELALLKCILIVRPDRPGLQNVEFITLMHNHLLDALKLAITTRQPAKSGQLLDEFLELLKGWSILDEMQEKYVHPIDLSHFSQGPWKVAEGGSGSSSASVSSKSEGAEEVGGKRLGVEVSGGVGVGVGVRMSSVIAVAGKLQECNGGGGGGGSGGSGSGRMVE